MYCRKCGKEVPENIRYCIHCGFDTSGSIKKKKERETQKRNYSFIYGLIGGVLLMLLIAAGVFFVMRNHFNEEETNASDKVASMNDSGDDNPDTDVDDAAENDVSGTDVNDAAENDASGSDVNDAEENDPSGSGSTADAGQDEKSVPDENDESTQDTDEFATEDMPSEATVVGTLPIDSDKQYKLNLFLSNFSEAWLTGYDSDEVDLFSVFHWVYIWCKINKGEYVESDRAPTNGHYMISLEHVNKVSKKYLGIEISEKDATRMEPVIEGAYEAFYRDGFYYETAADGEQYTCFSVVNEMSALGDNRYRLNYDIYMLDTDAYAAYEYEMPKKLYKMTPAEASASPEVELAGMGIATVTTEKGSDGKERYILLEYSPSFY